MRIKTLPQITNAIKETDPCTAINESMLNSLIEQGKIPFEKRGNRTVVDLDMAIPCLNQILALEGSEKIPRIRTIRNANAEIKEKLHTLGIGEKQIREAVDNKKIGTIHVGNRAYIALESFEEPYVTRIFSQKYDFSIQNKPNRAVEQFNEIISKNTAIPKVKRLRK